MWWAGQQGTTHLQLPYYNIVIGNEHSISVTFKKRSKINNVNAAPKSIYIFVLRCTQWLTAPFIYSVKCYTYMKLAQILSADTKNIDGGCWGSSQCSPRPLIWPKRPEFQWSNYGHLRCTLYTDQLPYTHNAYPLHSFHYQRMVCHGMSWYTINDAADSQFCSSQPLLFLQTSYW